ncbi:TIM barrel protein [Asanoa sp. NPDC049518]|uniref:sugar phosphate isomerase/epimerase family protein n=1 Tax=unclassified Asanoa TaxID=2685164 RepID=UPI00344AEBCB
MDPATLGFDLSLEEYATAVGAAGFSAAEWPVTWADPGPLGDYAPTLAAFVAARVTPLQFTSGMGVPGNLAVRAKEFRRRLVDFAGHCRSGHAVGSTRAAAFFDDRCHGGVELSEQEILGRATAVAAVAADHGVAVVIGWHGRRLLELCGRVYTSSGGAFGLIMDTYTLARYGLGPKFVRTLPVGAVGWVRLGDAVVAEGFNLRLLPGGGTVDIAGIVRACRSNGYSGPLSVEVNDAPPGTDARGKARRAYLCLEGVDL